MFESTGRVAVSPVVRLSGLAGPRSASGLAVRRALTAPPGPAVIGQLAAVDVRLLDDAERVELLQAWERAARWVAAQHAAAVVAVAGREPADRDDVGREYVRMALLGQGSTPRATVDTARALAGPLAAARDALAAGRVSEAHVRVLATETACLDDPVARAVTDAVLDAAPGRTPGQFRARVRAAVIRADPAGAEAAAERGRRQRRVHKSVLGDGQAELVVTGPAVQVQTVWTALDLRAARTSACDGRTLDQRRFDALVSLCQDADLHTDLHRDTDPHRATDPPAAPGPSTTRPAGGATGQAATGGAPSAPGAPGAPGRRRGLVPAVFLHADAATWSGLTDEPVHLDGYGPIPAGAAREHFGSSTWRAVVTDALTGRPVGVSDTTYRPSARTSRLLHLHDRGCQMPGCTAAVWHCDADHGTPHAQGGPTDPDNCALLCRRHHRLKTFHGWDWHRDEDGAVTWTDPHGHAWRRPADTHTAPGPARAAGPGRPPGAGVVLSSTRDLDPDEPPF